MPASTLCVNWTTSRSSGGWIPGSALLPGGARFGRLSVLQWLWIKGALQSELQVGWGDKGWAATDDTDPLILMWAAMGGHLAVVEFFVSEVGIPFRRKATEWGDSALHAACRYGSRQRDFASAELHCQPKGGVCFGEVWSCL
jgi:hypothetical protein